MLLSNACNLRVWLCANEHFQIQTNHCRNYWFVLPDLQRIIKYYGSSDRYSNSTGRPRNRIPVEARFSTLAQRPAMGPTRPPVQWIPALFPGVKRPGRGVEHPPPPTAKVKERAELLPYSPSGPSWPVLGSTHLYFTFIHLSLKRLTGTIARGCQPEQIWLNFVAVKASKYMSYKQEVRAVTR
jgi:hypothetical protein